MTNNLDSVASPEYRKVLQDTHAAMSWGGGGQSHAGTVAGWARELGVKTILDYGCGRATLGMALRIADSGLEVIDYDPGIPGKDAMPEPADMVVSTDVLEHVEPDRVDTVLRHMRFLARKGAFLTIALTLDKKRNLADGRNPHLSLHPGEWWLERLYMTDFSVAKFNYKKGLWVWTR